MSAITPRASADEVDGRIQKCYEMLLMGLRPVDIVRFGTKPAKRSDGTLGPPRWPVGPRQIKRYIAQARRMIAYHAAADRDYLLARGIARLEMLLANNFRIQDYKAALQVIREQNKLLGLYPAAEVDISWRSEAEQRGINAGDLFEALVRGYAAAIESSDR